MDPHSFFVDPDPAAFLLRIRIQLKKICNKLPYEDSSGVESDKKIAQKLKTMELVLIYLNVFHTITITTNFFTVFLFFPQIFSSWIWIHGSEENCKLHYYSNTSKACTVHCTVYSVHVYLKFCLCCFRDSFLCTKHIINQKRGPASRDIRVGIYE